jgi:hypothetical protein
MKQHLIPFEIVASNISLPGNSSPVALKAADRKGFSQRVQLSGHETRG